MRTFTVRRATSASQNVRAMELATVDHENHRIDASPKTATAMVKANCTPWPSTFDHATSRSHSRASKSRITPKAAERMIRFRPATAAPVTMSREYPPMRTQAIATTYETKPMTRRSPT